MTAYCGPFRAIARTRQELSNVKAACKLLARIVAAEGNSPTPRGGHQGHHTSHTHTTHTREVAELETPREEDFQPTYEVTEVPMEAVSRSSRADGAQRC